MFLEADGFGPEDDYVPSPEEQKQLRVLFDDRLWRLSHLYYIVDKNGDRVLFKPNSVQRKLIADLTNRNLVLKSRQHGVTTLICLLWLDACLFRHNTMAGIVAHKKEDSEAFFRNKVLYAYENLPRWLQRRRPIVRRDMSGELTFSNGSRISVSTSHRGGTLQMLHVSEYGPMVSMFPLRAKEVKTGALNTVSPDGIVVIESTAYGAYGEFYQMAQRAMTLLRMVLAGAARLTKMDYRFHFFGWFEDDTNEIDADDVPIGSELTSYFEQVEGEAHIDLSPRKRAWYAKKAEEQGDKMKQEHPSLPAEAFERAVEGAYFTREIARCEKEGRLCDLPIIPGVKVNTFWDIGRGDYTCIWFHQQVGAWHHFIDYYEANGEQAPHFVKVLRDRDYIYGRHFLPHDGIITEWAGTGNKTRIQILQEMLPAKVEMVERIDDITEGVDMLRRVFEVARFDRTRCGENPPGSGRGGLPSLRAYQRKWDEKQERWRDFPEHNWAADGTDALRTFAQGYPLRGINDDETRKRRKREGNWRTA